MLRLTGFPLILLAGVTLASTFSNQAASQDRYYPLDHRQPTGTAGRWSLLTHPARQGVPQPVRVHLPEGGNVTFYTGGPHQTVTKAAPAQASMVVGHVYRLKVSELPGYPGVELYPTVEVLDRLHPPEGLAEQFPIPIELTPEEIETAMQDRLVTKVVYLEQPDTAFPVEQTSGIHVEDVPVTANLLQVADQKGRPMAILRIGGRVPDPNSPRDEFHSQSPLYFTTP